MTATGPGGSTTETKENYITVTAPDISADPTSFDFGTVQVTSSDQTTITISNDGDAQLVISGFTITGTNADQFSIVSGGDPVNRLLANLVVVEMVFQRDIGIFPEKMLLKAVITSRLHHH